MNENEIQHILKSDSNLREAIDRREQQLPPMPADLNERVMGRMDAHPPQRRTYHKWIAAAACLLLAIGIGAMLLTKKTSPEEKPLAVNNIPETPQGQPTQRPLDMETETMDSLYDVTHAQATGTHILTTPSEGNGQSPKGQPALASTRSSHDIDSLQYYIDKIEKELAVVDDSLYIDRMNKVISADERLQRIVNSYILHTLDEENRPQTAENMTNVKKQEDENK